PETALADAEHACEHAREIGQAATLMYALLVTLLVLVSCGEYVTATKQFEELVALADKKSSLFWKALGMLQQGCVLVLTGNASAAIQMINSAVAALRSTGTTVWFPFGLSYLAKAYAELGKFDDAWRCIGEAMTAVETT